MGKGANASSRRSSSRRGGGAPVVFSDDDDTVGDVKNNAPATFSSEKRFDELIPGRKYTQIRGKTYDITSSRNVIREGVNS